jgi:uncharacterized membrane protein
MTDKILYEGEVGALKKADQRNLVIRFLVTFAYEMAILFVMILVLGAYAILLFIIALLLVLPMPLIPTPTKYKITKRGVILEKGKFFPLKKGCVIRVNEKRMFVSIIYRWRRGEVLRLYTPNPKAVGNILQKIILEL